MCILVFVSGIAFVKCQNNKIYLLRRKTEYYTHKEIFIIILQNLKQFQL